MAGAVARQRATRQNATRQGSREASLSRPTSQSSQKHSREPAPRRSVSPGPRAKTSPGKSRQPSSSPPPTAPARPRSVCEVRAKLSPEPRDITEVFRQFDVNGDGVIDRGELAAVLQELDPIRWTSRNVTLLLMSADANYDGRIHYEEFVSWVSAEGDDQTEFRNATGMPRSRAELAKFENERKAAALRGTAAELESERKVVASRVEALKVAETRLSSTRARYEKLKAEAEKTSEMFMPAYNQFRDAVSSVTVPTRALLEHDINEVCQRLEVEDAVTHAIHKINSPPSGAQLTAQGMCILFQVHPGTRCNLEPDYWSAFMDAVLTPKLLEQMDAFDKESVSPSTVERLGQLCDDPNFDPQQVRHDSSGMGQTTGFIVAMCSWIHFISKYQKAGVKHIWDQVQQAEIVMSKDEIAMITKEDELKDARRKVARLEVARAAIE